MLEEKLEMNLIFHRHCEISAMVEALSRQLSLKFITDLSALKTIKRMILKYGK